MPDSAAGQPNDDSKDQKDKNTAESAQTISEPDAAQGEQEKSETGAVLDALSDEEKQSYEQWMRRVPDDPSGLLRRKFEQQARERARIRREEGEPLW